MRFNLYAAGTSEKIVEDFKKSISYDQLLSQLNERKGIKDFVQYLKEHPECHSKLFVDSGAYSAHTLGKTVDVDDYIKFINEIDDYVTVFAQVDKIPGVWGRTPTVEEAASAPKESWDNYLYMVDKVKSPKKLIPVFHQGEDFKWLKNMINYQYPDGSYIDYIGLSCNKSLKTISNWYKWFEECFKVISTSNNPNVKTHAFGMTSQKLLEQFPFTSSDSTTWVRTASFGNVILPETGYILYVSSQDEGKYSITKNQETIVKNICDKIGCTLQDVRDYYYYRCIFNIYVLNEWAEQYTPHKVTHVKKSLW